MEHGIGKRRSRPDVFAAVEYQQHVLVRNRGGNRFRYRPARALCANQIKLKPFRRPRRHFTYERKIDEPHAIGKRLSTSVEGRSASRDFPTPPVPTSASSRVVSTALRSCTSS